MPKRLAVVDGDATNAQDVGQLALRDIIIRLVGRDAKLVEAAALLARFV